MKILITAGGTSEKIDKVRKITNVASGRLGALIAEEFAAQFAVEIFYVCGVNAVIPAFETVKKGEKAASIKVIKIESVDELKNVVTQLFTQHKFDAVIHSMAVSDYAVRCVTSAQDMVSSIAEKLSQDKQSQKSYDSLVETINSAIFKNEVNINNSGYGNSGELNNISSRDKISSDIDDLIIFMNKTPKIIKLIKQMQPETVLVGFKLLVNVDENTLLRIGHDLLVKNNCDFVFANDLEQIGSVNELKQLLKDSHKGILIKPDASFQRLHSKKEIAEAITKNVLAKVMNCEFSSPLSISS